MTQELSSPANSTRFIKIRSWQCKALTPVAVDIEVLRTRGLNQLILTGLPDAWLKDSRDKLRALAARWANWGPFDRILIHLLPADESKNGAHLEFPILIGCLLALNPTDLPESSLQFLENYALVGSITLEGNLVHTSVSRVLERSLPDSTVGPSRFRNIADFLEFLIVGANKQNLPEVFSEPTPTQYESESPIPSNIRVQGRYWERLWLLSAAVAQVPTLLMGPPGAGKSHLAQWAGQSLPNLSNPIRAQVDQIWGLAGREAPQQAPVINPHSRTHIAEFLGHSKGGVSRPGWFSLAHGGTLILDEFPEMNRDCREILRTILDQKRILRQSAGERLEWPARFWLLSTANPCPCGYARGDDISKCSCPESVRSKYQTRMSGPLLDRFSLKLYVPEEDAQRSVESWIAHISLDAEPVEIRKLILDARARMTETIPLADIFIRQEAEFQRMSERGKIGKVLLLAAFCAITQKSISEIGPLLSIVYRMEEPLFHRKAVSQNWRGLNIHA